MIKNIIFDFGDIFINLDKPATAREMGKFGFETLTPDLEFLFQRYEKGMISSEKFISAANQIFPSATPAELLYAWNAIILDFPEYRLEFIEDLVSQYTYRVFLLSNTNALHIEKVRQNMGRDRYERFKKCFERFYLSHEIQLRKPDADSYRFVLDENQLIAQETLFVDDTLENTDAAQQLGIKTWHLQVGVEDIVNLKSKL
ncbi:MAG: HAD family phosphatase [Saonia sp.]